MSVADLYVQAMQWPGPDELAQAVVTGVGLVAVAAVLLTLGYLQIIGRTLGVLGVLCLMFVLLVLHEQTINEPISPEIRVTRARYPEDMRFLLRVSLVSLPLGAGLVMGAVLASTWRRQREDVPMNLSRALFMFHNREYDAALEMLDEAARITPEDGDVFFYRGRVHEARGEDDLALEDYDLALTKDRDNPSTLLHRGRLRTEKGRYDEALEDLERALGLRPFDAETLLARGVCFARSGVITRAVSDFQRVLKLTNQRDYTDPALEYLKLYSPLFEVPNPSTLPASIAGEAPSDETPPEVLNWVI